MAIVVLSKQTGFNQDSVIWKMTGKNQDLMLQIFSNRTNSKQENIRIPCRPCRPQADFSHTNNSISVQTQNHSTTKRAVRNPDIFLFTVCSVWKNLQHQILSFFKITESWWNKKTWYFTPIVKSRNPDKILFVHYLLHQDYSEQTGSHQDFEI